MDYKYKVKNNRYNQIIFIFKSQKSIFPIV